MRVGKPSGRLGPAEDAAKNHHEAQPTQKTRPQGKDKKGWRHKPADLPVPTRKEVFGLVRSVRGKRSARDREVKPSSEVGPKQHT